MKVKKTIFLAISFFLILLFCLVLLNNLMVTAYSDRYSSESIKEAKENHVFVKRADITPKVLYIDGKIIRITDCWIEKESRIYNILFFKISQFLGHYRLCFRAEYSESSMSYDYPFNMKTLNDGVVCIEPQLGTCIYSAFVGLDKPQKIEVALVKKNIEIKNLSITTK